MISRGSEAIANWLIKKAVINQGDYDLYYYAAYSLLVTVLPLALALFVGGVMGTPVNSLLVILPFMLIRKYSGGYHTSNSNVCMVISIIILSIFTWLSNYVVWSRWLGIIVLISAINLSIFSPIESKNKKLNENEKRKYKKITMCLLLLSILVIGWLEEKGIFRVMVCTSMGIVLTACLQVPIIAKNMLEKCQNQIKNVVSCK